MRQCLVLTLLSNAAQSGPTKFAVGQLILGNSFEYHRKTASILLQKMLAEFEIMLESDASKHLKMKNGGWMAWVASFRGPASIGCAEMLAGLIFLAGLTNQPAFCFKKCWLNLKSDADKPTDVN